MRKKSRDKLMARIQDLEAEMQKCYDKINSLINENRELRYESSGKLDIDMQLLQRENGKLSAHWMVNGTVCRKSADA